MWQTAVGKLGIQAATESAHKSHGAQSLQNVLTKLDQGEYGYAELLQDEEYLASVENTLNQLGWADTLVVVGIGGSDLGGRTIQNALQRQDALMRVLFHGDTTDPNDIDSLLREVELPNTVFNIVSKSGNTMETIAYYLYLKQLYLDRESDWRKHFVFTTGNSGPLWQEAQTHEISVLNIPENVGGRFSVLSAVGMLPAAAMGVDVHDMWRGAAAAITQTKSLGDKSIAWQLAWEQYLLTQQGVDAVVFMPYSRKLEEFGRWLRQLWAESLGKDGKGILPIQARGPADQHSQLQFYLEGKFLASIQFICIEDHGVSYTIARADVPGFAHLENKEFSELIALEQSTTAESLKQIGRPSAALEIERIDANSLGMLFMTYMLAVTCLGELLEIDAFNQPLVEESKKLMHTKLA